MKLYLWNLNKLFDFSVKNVYCNFCFRFLEKKDEINDKELFFEFVFNWLSFYLFTKISDILFCNKLLMTFFLFLNYFRLIIFDTNLTKTYVRLLLNYENFFIICTVSFLLSVIFDLRKAYKRDEPIPTNFVLSWTGAFGCCWYLCIENLVCFSFLG